MQELNTATCDDTKSEIQCLLKKAEKEIREWKEEVNEIECQVSEHEESLSKLREGEFAVRFCPVCTCIATVTYYMLTESQATLTDTAVLKSKSSILSPPASPSPVTTLYTCPSCGDHYHSDKRVQHSGGERCVSCSHGYGQQQAESLV